MTHWRKMMNPDFLGAWAFEPGEEKAGVIEFVQEEQIKGADGQSDTCPVIHFRGNDLKPLVLNVTNARTIEKLFETADVESWKGRAVILHAVKVKAFGEIVEAVRVKRELPVICENCGGVVRPVKGHTVQEIVRRSREKLGKTFCVTCASRLGT